LAGTLSISARGELEMIDFCKIYLERRKLDAMVFGRGTVWLDLGSPDSPYGRYLIKILETSG
jgi:glucose-1-phosphate thymidylyltransferase